MRCFAVAVAGLVTLWLAALTLLNHPALPHSKVISLHDTVGVAQLVFASVAGVGALVALVVAYRRQRVAETTAAQASGRGGHGGRGSGGAVREWWLWVVDFQVSADSGGDGAQVAFV
jgi:hypothetical protein